MSRRRPSAAPAPWSAKCPDRSPRLLMPNNVARPPLDRWHKAKPRRKVTPVLELASVANRGDRRSRRHRADPFDLAETLADLAVAREPSDLSLVTGSRPIRASSSVTSSRSSAISAPIQSAVLIVAAEPRQTPPQIADILCDDNALLRLQRPRQGELSMNPWL